MRRGLGRASQQTQGDDKQAAGKHEPWSEPMGPGSARDQHCAWPARASLGLPMRNLIDG
jgi:hypothetical protein